MLKNLHYLFFFLVLGYSSPQALGQHGQLILNQFDALQVDEGIQITCVISSGNTCVGIDVFRSDDSVNFQLIGDIPGICGSTTNAIRYDFLDENPQINATNYYKLELGGVGFTEVISLTIRDLTANEIRIQPNPAQNQSAIYFSNPSFNTHRLLVMNYAGETLIQQTTTNDFFLIDVTKLPSGVYPILIETETVSQRKSGKLVVHH